MLPTMARPASAERPNSISDGKMPRCTLGIRSSTAIAYVLGAIVDGGGRCEEEARQSGAVKSMSKPRSSLRPTLGHGRVPRVRLGRRAAGPSWSIPRLRGRRGRFRGRRRGQRGLPAVARPRFGLGRGSPGPGGPAPGLARLLGGAAQRSPGLSGQRRRRGRRGGHLGEVRLRVGHFWVFFYRLLVLVLLWQPFGFDLLV